MHSDAKGGDPDVKSPTLRFYHKILRSKALPNGKIFELTNKKSGAYLYHKSELGEFFLGSDWIANSYEHHKRKEWLTKQIPWKVYRLSYAVSTIGAFIIYPNKRIDGKHTINQARGVNSYIDDRFDLTLECIRLYYLGQESPLYNTLSDNKKFFDLFENFSGYTNFFMLDDLVDSNQKIKFFLPFKGFKTKPAFADTGDYLIYKQGLMDFIKSRNKRIKSYSNQMIMEEIPAANKQLRYRKLMTQIRKLFIF